MAFGAYAVLAGGVGAAGGLDGLALSVCAGAILLCAFPLAALPHVTTSAWAALIVSSVLGVGLAFSFDFLAASLVSARVVGTLFSVDPVVAAITGLVVLQETIPLVSVTGIVLIVLSGAVVIATSGHGGAKQNSGRRPMGSRVPRRRADRSGQMGDLGLTSPTRNERLPTEVGRGPGDPAG